MGGMFCLLRMRMWGKDERGQGLVSYAVLLMFMVVACIGSFTVFGSSVVEMFNKIQTSFP
jgi:Flp pilus assembly pilin Flp